MAPTKTSPESLESEEGNAMQTSVIGWRYRGAILPAPMANLIRDQK